MSFLIGYHKDQGIDAPFKKSGAANAASVYAHIMQKELSDWINTRSIKIDKKIAKELSKPFTES